MCFFFPERVHTIESYYASTKWLGSHLRAVCQGLGQGGRKGNSKTQSVTRRICSAMCLSLITQSNFDLIKVITKIITCSLSIQYLLLKTLGVCSFCSLPGIIQPLSHVIPRLSTLFSYWMIKCRPCIHFHQEYSKHPLQERLSAGVLNVLLFTVVFNMVPWEFRAVI